MKEFNQEDRKELEMIKDSLKLNQKLFFKVVGQIMDAANAGDLELKMELTTMKYKVTRTINHLFDEKRKLVKKKKDSENQKNEQTDLFPKSFGSDL